MADFISDADMMKLEKQGKVKTPQVDTNFISDEEMMRLEKGVEKPKESLLTKSGLIKGALEALPMAGGMFGGALGLASPVPGGAVTGAGLGAAGGEALKQIGEKYLLDEEAKPLAERAKDITQQGLIGASGEMGGQIIGEVLPMIGRGLKKAGTKISEALTGIPEQEIKTYAKNADKIKEMAKASDNSTIEAADQIRLKYAKDIKSTKDELNNTISEALKNSKKTIDSSSILDSLESYKSKINEKLYPEQVGQIDDLVSKINSIAKDGKMSTYEAHQVKQFLQDKASSAYSNPGEIFSIGTEAAKAAKDAAAKARILINTIEPDIAKANNQLSKLHSIEDSMNTNVLKVGKPESALIAAGSGGNLRNARALEKLGEMTNTPMLEEAQNLAAMRSFGSPKLMAADVTGKAAARLAAGTGLGFFKGGPLGALIGGAATSPAALRYGIDLGRFAGKGIGKLGLGPLAQPTSNILTQGLLRELSKREDKQ